MESEQSRSEIDGRLKTFSSDEGGTAGHLYLGAGLLHCGLCGALLNADRYYAIQSVDPLTVYLCRKQDGGCGRTIVDTAVVDAILREFVIDRSTDPCRSSTPPENDWLMFIGRETVGLNFGQEASTGVDVAPDGESAPPSTIATLWDKATTQERRVMLNTALRADQIMLVPDDTHYRGGARLRIISHG